MQNEPTRALLALVFRSARLLFGILFFIAFATSRACAAVVINEIHYHPKDKTSPSEFIELLNTGTAEVSLAGWKFDTGVKFTFPEGTKIAPGGFVVIVKNRDGFKAAFGKDAVGAWKGKLKNDGEALVLRDEKGAVVDQVRFGTGFPWPTAADGEGASLELVNPAMDRLAGSSWRSSGFVPGKAEVGKPTPGERNSTASDVPPPSISAPCNGRNAPHKSRAGRRRSGGRCIR